MNEREVENILEKDLVEQGWNISANDVNQNVYRQNPRSKEEQKLLGRDRPDFILYENNLVKYPLAIIETKKPQYKNLEEALTQAYNYAEKLKAKFIFLYNYNRYIAFYRENKKPLIIDGEEVENILDKDTLLKFHSNVLYTQNTINITSKSDLINVFRYANDQLKETGLTIGMERFTEFANILFLKLISEKNKELGYNFPEHILWDSFKKKEGDELLSYLNNVVIPGLTQRFEAHNIFSKIQIKSDKIRNLKNIIDKLDSLNLESINEDIKGEAFEYFIRRYNTSNKDLGEYFTPRHLVEFLVTLMNPQYNEKIYDPFCGTGGMLIKTFNHIKEDLKSKKMLNENTLDFLRNKTIYGSEISNTARIAKMNMILTGDGYSNIYQQDTFLNPVEGKYNVVITNIPFTVDVTDQQARLYNPYTKNSNGLSLNHIIDSLDNINTNSRAAIIVPEQTLFIPSLSGIREKLIKENLLLGVISLPPGVFLPYTEAKTSVLILKSKNSPKIDDVFFYKVEHEGFTLTTRRRSIPGINDLDEFVSLFNEMKENQFNGRLTHDNLDYLTNDEILGNSDKSLLLFRYKEKDKTGFIRLNRILEEVKVKNTNFYDTASITNSEFWGMPTGLDYWGENFVSVTSQSNEKYNVAHKGCISFNPSRANVGSFGINVNETPVAISTAYPIYQTFNDEYLAEYVYLQLKKNDEVITDIKTRCAGTVRQSLGKTDFLNIQIPIKTLEEQKKIVEKARKLYIEQYNLNNAIENFNPNI